jgi:predicted phage-related endonuclease
MKITHLKQGSPEWLAHRRTTRNASEASVMMGACPSISRRELVRLRAVGLEREHSDYVQRFILDRGHEVEPALRAIAEQMLGEDLYPVVAVSDDGYLGASFDGVTLAEDVIFEAKQSNADKRVSIDAGEIPGSDYWQVVQQFAVCETADRCLYLVGDGTDAGTARLTILRSDIEHDIQKLRAGWEQFDRDVVDYVPEDAPASVAIGRAPESLPALRVEVTGMVTASNLADFKAQALVVLDGINRNLQTDEDFANAEQTVKWCKGVEERLAATKDAVLSQTADIEAVFRTMDEVSAETRRIRLELDKLVTREKEARRTDIVQAGVAAMRQHYATINATLGSHALSLPASLNADMGAAIKGKKSLTSMRDAVDSAAAAAKIAASQQAERVRANVAILADQPEDVQMLFADRVQLCASKAPDDLRNLITARVAEHQQRERDRQEREHQQRAAVQPVTPAPAPTPMPVAAPAIAAVAVAPDKRIKLGDINGWIAPLSITADGLATLGFRPVGTERTAKLYAANDFPAICNAMARVLTEAIDRASEQTKEAA